MCIYTYDSYRYFECLHICHEKGCDTPADTFTCVKNDIHELVEKRTKPCNS